VPKIKFITQILNLYERVEQYVLPLKSKSKEL
ncbi:undecaprenyl-diphosphatase, partial [Bacillus anthracis]|nr:undecaprenyl-diphosphatase [Bacillus anthracis]